ncbi:MAG: serine/threonine protein kinase, partial [Myxococcales bacterium]|nr:serine/threonine protein kinase [Myxococcales bacterium]
MTDRYTEEILLGRGGFADVHRVADARLGRRIARKTLRDDRDPERFLAEARLTAQLAHPGIVAVHDLLRSQNAFTMAEVVGRSFEDAITAFYSADPGSWTLRRLVEVLHRVAEAVAYAHRSGVVHRDLKPDNVMVGAFGQVVVLDWGGAVVLPWSELVDVDALRAREDAVLSGTPSWMAPEQATGTGISLRTDVYGLGAMLFAVLAGRGPFGDAPAPEVLTALRQGDIPTVPASDDAPAELRALCARAM